MMDGRRPRSVGLTAVTFPRLWLLAVGCDADGSCGPRRPRWAPVAEGGPTARARPESE